MIAAGLSVQTPSEQFIKSKELGRLIADFDPHVRHKMELGPVNPTQLRYSADMIPEERPDATCNILYLQHVVDRLEVLRGFGNGPPTVVNKEQRAHDLPAEASSDESETVLPLRTDPTVQDSGFGDYEQPPTLVFKCFGDALFAAVISADENSLVVLDFFSIFFRTLTLIWKAFEIGEPNLERDFHLVNSPVVPSQFLLQLNRVCDSMLLGGMIVETRITVLVELLKAELEAPQAGQLLNFGAAPMLNGVVGFAKTMFDAALSASQRS